MTIHGDSKSEPIIYLSRDLTLDTDHCLNASDAYSDKAYVGFRPIFNLFKLTMYLDIHFGE